MYECLTDGNMFALDVLGINHHNISVLIDSTSHTNTCLSFRVVGVFPPAGAAHAALSALVGAGLCVHSVLSLQSMLLVHKCQLLS